jgi:hypothetical protein
MALIKEFSAFKTCVCVFFYIYIYTKLKSLGWLTVLSKYIPITVGTEFQ